MAYKLPLAFDVSTWLSSSSSLGIDRERNAALFELFDAPLDVVILLLKLLFTLLFHSINVCVVLDEERVDMLFSFTLDCLLFEVKLA